MLIYRLLRTSSIRNLAPIFQYFRTGKLFTTCSGIYTTTLKHNGCKISHQR